jgi:hypothetical protein
MPISQVLRICGSATEQPSTWMVCLKEHMESMIHDSDPSQGLQVIREDPRRSLTPLSLLGNVPLVLVSQHSDDSVLVGMSTLLWRRLYT